MTSTKHRQARHRTPAPWKTIRHDPPNGHRTVPRRRTAPRPAPEPASAYLALAALTRRSQ